MYSDTHFHFSYIIERSSQETAANLLSQMAENDVYFAMDIGTKSGDLKFRHESLEKCLSALPEKIAEKARNFLYYSAGIWPSPESIKNRGACMEELKKQIEEFKKTSTKLVAIGEGGLDHHWNPSGPDGRREEDFDEDLLNGEKELFLMQLELAKEMDLPFIVHSRDAFEDTFQCIKESSYNNGIIHCYSYGKEEAKAFLDSGWYIALGGAVTYTKKRDMEKMTDLLRYIPEDRLLLETDAPYLAPVPLRGTMNTPVNIVHTYNFIAQARNTDSEKICEIVDKNIKKLFRLV